MKRVFVVLVACLLLSNNVKAEGGHPNLKSNIMTWVKQNLSYPTKAINNKEEGIVYVSFQILENNKVANVVIEQGISKALNKEALEVVSQMVLPQTYNSETPEKRYVLPIKFTIK